MADRRIDSRALAVGYQLLDFQILDVLGHGAFGITYLALDKSLQTQVAVKEYFPREFSERKYGGTVTPTGSKDDQEFFEWGLDRFLSEARILARLNHPNIVAVRRLLEANQTAYLVMDYCDGRPLDQIIEADGVIDTSKFTKIFFPLLDALEHVHHAGLIHRDVKPANIFIRDDGTPVLLDFGAARNDVSQNSKSITSLATAGYAPLEQYDTRGNQGPWSDIYGLSATSYRALTGDKPPDAAGRVLQDSLVPLTIRFLNSRYQDFLSAIDAGLAILPKNRPQTIKEWRVQLGNPSPELIDQRKAVNDALDLKNKPENISVYVNQSRESKLFDPHKVLAVIAFSVVLVGLIKISVDSEKTKVEQLENSNITPTQISDEQISDSAHRSGEQFDFSLNEDERRQASEGSAHASNDPSPCVGANEASWDKCVGKKIDKNGDEYEGAFQHGKANGKGKAIFKDSGDIYVGGWKDDLLHGKGTYIYKDGSIFEGTYALGKKIGEGKHTFKNGDIFIGNYVNNLLEGASVFKSKSGDVSEVNFKKGVAQNPQKVKLANGDSYVGDIVNDKWHGKGTYTFSSGTRYVGEYREGKRHGSGTEYSRDGVILRTGTWRDGEIAVSDEIVTFNDGPAATPSTSTSKKSTVPSSTSFSTPTPTIAPKAEDYTAMQNCEAEAKTVRKTLPKTLDLVTKLTDVSCAQTRRGVLFIYRNFYDGEFSADGAALGEAHAKLRNSLVGQWCSTSLLKTWLQTLDVEYQYYDQNWKLGLVVTLSRKDCT